VYCAECAPKISFDKYAESLASAADAARVQASDGSSAAAVVRTERDVREQRDAGRALLVAQLRRVAVRVCVDCSRKLDARDIVAKRELAVQLESETEAHWPRVAVELSERLRVQRDAVKAALGAAAYALRVEDERRVARWLKVLRPVHRGSGVATKGAATVQQAKNEIASRLQKITHRITLGGGSPPRGGKSGTRTSLERAVGGGWAKGGAAAVSAVRQAKALRPALRDALLAFLSRHTRQRKLAAMEREKAAAREKGGGEGGGASPRGRVASAAVMESEESEAKRVLTALCSSPDAAQRALWALGAVYLEVPPPPTRAQVDDGGSTASGTGVDDDAAGGERQRDAAAAASSAAALNAANDELQRAYWAVKQLPDLIRAAHAAGSAAFQRAVAVASGVAATDTLRTMLMNRMLTKVTEVTIELSAPRMKMKRGLLFTLEGLAASGEMDTSETTEGILLE